MNAFIFLNMMIGIVLDVMQKESAQMALDNGEGEEAELQSLRNDVRGLKAQLDRMESALAQAYSTAPRTRVKRAASTPISPQLTDFRRAAMMLTDPAKSTAPLWPLTCPTASGRTSVSKRRLSGAALTCATATSH
ncbi:hypothetical protein HORIV_24680 [Vreelandella olivaria]|uniref:Ion transport domain-containing protein n=1 Tax=Vreelandella olivaria TaxID=390919 RepID=A0ABN5WVV3_9GAMM|nr:hypothetical protein HORIV_24680 [Halomonas olivaria]